MPTHLFVQLPSVAQFRRLRGQERRPGPRTHGHGPGQPAALLKVLVLGVRVGVAAVVAVLLAALAAAAVPGHEAEDEGRHRARGDGDDEGLQGKEDLGGVDDLEETKQTNVKSREAQFHAWFV